MWVLKNKIDEVVFVSDNVNDLRKIQLSNILYKNLNLKETNYLYFAEVQNKLQDRKLHIGLIKNQNDYEIEINKGCLISFTLKELDKKIKEYNLESIL